MKRFQGIVRVTGIVFCFAGFIVLAFYQGPEIKSFNHHRLLHHTSNSYAAVTVHSVRTWLLGIFLMTLGTICWAFWTVLQVWISSYSRFKKVNICSWWDSTIGVVHYIFILTYTYTLLCSQGPMLEAYPSKLLNATLQIVFATIQSFFIALVIETDFSRWKLKLDSSLVAVLYSVSNYSLCCKL
jgi:hypothetical protein